MYLFDVLLDPVIVPVDTITPNIRLFGNEVPRDKTKRHLGVEFFLTTAKNEYIYICMYSRYRTAGNSTTTTTVIRVQYHTYSVKKKVFTFHVVVLILFYICDYVYNRENGKRKE